MQASVMTGNIENVPLPSQIASVVKGLSLEQLKHRIITENGMTLAQEEEILEEAKNPEIEATLKTPEDIKNYFKRIRENSSYA